MNLARRLSCKRIYIYIYILYIYIYIHTVYEVYEYSSISQNDDTPQSKQYSLGQITATSNRCLAASAGMKQNHCCESARGYNSPGRVGMSSNQADFARHPQMFEDNYGFFP